MSQSITIIAAQLITATGNEVTGHSVVGDSLSVQIIASAVSGTTPSATFSVLWSDDGVTYSQASPADVFTALTGVGNIVERFASKGSFYKIAWVVSGTTPSFTTTVEVFN